MSLLRARTGGRSGPDGSRGQVLLFSGVGMVFGGGAFVLNGLAERSGGRLVVGTLLVLVGLGYVVWGNVATRRSGRGR